MMPGQVEVMQINSGIYSVLAIMIRLMLIVIATKSVVS